ncbi:hypothetical protein HMI54_004888 [Coelomomyces lativittatus]|nr:hypothetical protein HMI54_004888 [Coelomomyces lativittatus]
MASGIPSEVSTDEPLKNPHESDLRISWIREKVLHGLNFNNEEGIELFNSCIRSNNGHDALRNFLDANTEETLVLFFLDEIGVSDTENSSSTFKRSIGSPTKKIENISISQNNEAVDPPSSILSSPTNILVESSQVDADNSKNDPEIQTPAEIMETTEGGPSIPFPKETQTLNEVVETRQPQTPTVILKVFRMAIQHLPEKIAQVQSIFFLRNSSSAIPIPTSIDGK